MGIREAVHGGIERYRNFQVRRKEREARLHEQPTTDNFFWLMGKLPTQPFHLESQGSEVIAWRQRDPREKILHVTMQLDAQGFYANVGFSLSDGKPYLMITTDIEHRLHHRRRMIGGLRFYNLFMPPEIEMIGTDAGGRDGEIWKNAYSVALNAIIRGEIPEGIAHWSRSLTASLPQQQFDSTLTPHPGWNRRTPAEMSG